MTEEAEGAEKQEQPEQPEGEEPETRDESTTWLEDLISVLMRVPDQEDVWARLTNKGRQGYSLVIDGLPRVWVEAVRKMMLSGDTPRLKVNDTPEPDNYCLIYFSSKIDGLTSELYDQPDMVAGKLAELSRGDPDAFSTAVLLYGGSQLRIGRPVQQTVIRIAGADYTV